MEGVFGSVCHNCTALECGHAETRQSDYRGSINVTESNRTCLPWDVHEPHEHFDITSDTFPAADLVGNFCRSPDAPHNRAWCYTTDPEKEWEYCAVPVCADKGLATCGTKQTKQADYRGVVSQTASGKKCQNWALQEPHWHEMTPERKPFAALESNYCR